MEKDIELRATGFGKTDRRDSWWAAPLATAIALGLFGVYGIVRALMFRHYETLPPNFDFHYLSPFYSPKIFLPGLEWLSPAFLVLWAPLGFRVTCYYYRKAYYRAYFADPPACAVGEFRKHYRGESSFPFIFQNIHRYFLYAALVVLVFLWIDVYQAMWSKSGFRIGVGTIILAGSTALLTSYTLSCHSLRHIMGGKRDCFGHPSTGVGASHKIWSCLSKFNEHHMLWAWCSLFAVQFSDFYIWMVSSGRITDFRII